MTFKATLKGKVNGDGTLTAYSIIFVYQMINRKK